MIAWPRMYRMPWNPWDEFDRLHREMQRFVGSVTGPNGNREFPPVNISATLPMPILIA